MNVIPFGDELQQFPRALHTLEPAWLHNDLFVGAPQGDHWLFFRFLSGLFWVAGPIGGAILARGIIWALMAVAIVTLGRSLRLSPGAVFLAIVLFVALEQCRLGGETIVGEAIARHLSYPFVLFALAFWLRGRFLLCPLFLGVATSIHALVGAWATAMMLFAVLFDERIQSRRWQLIPLCGIVYLLSSLPGLIPLMPLMVSAHAAGAPDADDIFIYFRHPHHLNPGSWPVADYVHVALTLMVFFVFSQVLRHSAEIMRLRRFILICAAALLVSIVVGVLIAEPFFLKLHPYRLAPPLVTLASCLCLAHVVLGSRIRLLRGTAVGAIAVLGLLWMPRGIYHYWQSSEGRLRPEEIARLDALEWIKTSTPADAVVLANPGWSDVQWKARRSHVVSFKLIPFESPRIGEWFKRLQTIVGSELKPEAGHRTQQRITAAFDEREAKHVIAEGEAMGAQYIITPAPCDAGANLAYANPFYCIYGAPNSTARDSSFLVVRYDDYAPYYDGQNKNIEIPRRLFELAQKHEGQVSVGVIPFPSDPRLTAEAAERPSSWLDRLEEGPWPQLLRDHVERGVVEPALHGFEHRLRTPSGHRKAEYRHQPFVWQQDTLRLGRDALAAALTVPIRVFIPPWNAWDTNTSRALEELEFEWLSPDLHQAEADTHLKIAPQTTADPSVALEIMMDASTPLGSVLVLVTHPFDFENQGGQGEAYFQGLEKVYEFAASSPRWASVGFADLPPDSSPAWNARFRGAVDWERFRLLVNDLPIPAPAFAREPAPYRPFHWYQDNLWRLRVWFLAPTLMCAIAFLLCGMVLGRLPARPHLAVLCFVVLMCAVAYLAQGALEIAGRGYAIRGIRWLAIICSSAGAAGFGIAALTRINMGHRKAPVHSDDANIRECRAPVPV